MFVNNFDEIRKLLKWEKEGDYYYVQLILRKKDGTTTHGNKNNSARLIRSYQFFNIDQFNAKEIEIIKECELHGCRAGINLNKRNEEQVALELNTQLAKRLQSKNYKGINGILNTVNGAKIVDDEDTGEYDYKGSVDKFWLIDCDTVEEYEAVLEILKDSSIKPEGEKIITILPTYTGYHIITNRFDRMVFNKLLSTKLTKIPDIHKNNPVSLYYPLKKDVEDGI